MKYVSLFFLIVLLSCYGKSPEKTDKEGKSIPEFSLLLMDSITNLETKNIPSGQPFAFFLFGPQCPHSKNQMREIIANSEKLKGIHIYAITPFPFNQIKQWYSLFELNKYPNITLGADTTNFFGDYMEVSGVPFMAIYDKNKQLKKAFLGVVTSTQIRATAFQ